MACFYGSENRYQHLNKRIAKVTTLIWLGWMFVIYFIVFIQLLKNNFSFANLLANILIFGPIYLFVEYQFRKERSTLYKFAKGIRGEKNVYSILKSLPDDFIIWRDYKQKDWSTDIDFIIIGPTGIFSIEVKSHKGEITMGTNVLLRNGKPFEKDILFQAKSGSILLTDFLRSRNIYLPEIQSIIVFSNKNIEIHFGLKPINGIFVIGAGWLVELIQKDMNKGILTIDQIEQVKRSLSKVV